MSDFLFTSSSNHAGLLAQRISAIYSDNPPEVIDFNGAWGGLAVSKNHYRGFLPYETERFLLVVIGGPVLCFCDNDFLVKDDSHIGSQRIYQRWVVEGSIQWDKDLSGPFAIVLVDKNDGSITYVTDLMSFVPLYSCRKDRELYLGSHVDALAESCDESSNYDDVSLADFILNDVVTFPFTVYEKISQVPPGSVCRWKEGEERVEAYWVPTERIQFKNIGEASVALRTALTEFIGRVTLSMNTVAQFISGGEDSRAVAGGLPTYLKRDAFVFLDKMNREGRIAEKVASKYGARLCVGYRSKTHYLDILPTASRLLGGGSQFFHAHSLVFDRKYQLPSYTAVFGGFLSDTLLKAHHVKKAMAYSHFPFLPQIRNHQFTSVGARYGRLATKIRCSEQVRKRQEKRLSELKAIRPNTAEEWFNFYPCSMHNDMPNFFCTRRLFRSYEPFMCNEIVKLSASVPTAWKMNRRLFRKAMRPLLRPSRWLFHSDGRLPYLSWWMNVPIQFSIWLYLKLAKRIGLIDRNQGPWGDWKALFRDSAWNSAIDSYAAGDKVDWLIKSEEGVKTLLASKETTRSQKLNLLQTLWGVRRRADDSAQ